MNAQTLAVAVTADNEIEDIVTRSGPSPVVDKDLIARLVGDAREQGVSVVCFVKLVSSVLWCGFLCLCNGFSSVVLGCYFSRACVRRQESPLCRRSRPWWMSRSMIAAAMLSSPNMVPQRENSMLVVMMRLDVSYAPAMTW